MQAAHSEMQKAVEYQKEAEKIDTKGI